MTVAQQVNERLAALLRAGTSPWLDQIRRSLIECGELERMMREDSLRGVTANPAIFEKAILGSPDYDDALADLARQDLDAESIYERLAIADVQAAADVLRPVWDETGGADGFISLEVAPELARDTEGTMEQVRDYWKRLDRPNVMIKIPGTAEGMPAIEQATFEGINVNVTLLFAVEKYEQCAEAYIRGLERRREAGERVDDMHSVASFFVSRVDTEVDRRLDQLGHTELCGTAALANARLAYSRFKQIFYGERFAELRDEGAFVQRPLWASTGVKNPRYPETMYVDGLIAPDTVNTMPLQTLMAFGERGQVPGATADQPEEKIRETLDALAKAGIDLDDVTAKLLDDGIVLFEESLHKLLAGIEKRRAAVVTGRPETIEAHFPPELERAVADRVKRAADEDVVRRIWRKDETLWAPLGTPEIANRLGWLTITEPMLEEKESIESFARECAADGLRDAVLLGMGGSSLAPEVLRESFEPKPDALRLHVLDSTDAGAILAVEREIDLENTLFVVSTKSGGTIETLSLARYFLGKAPNPGRQFIAITDPGSGLVDFAESNGFRRVFLADPDIGGRYSALSHFGLVPAALAGIDIGALLERAQVAEQRCAAWEQSETNSGLWLGCALGECAVKGRDKLTFIVADRVGAFGLWVEQLVAESTGKEGKGIVPIVDEPLGEADAYGNDRVFVHIRDQGNPDSAAEELVQALSEAGHPTVTVQVEEAEDLGSLFFFAEFATAVAGWVLGINPFDQPNVQEAKDNTKKVLDRYASEGELPAVKDASDEALNALVTQAEPGRYFAVMGFLAPSTDVDAAVEELRATVRDKSGAATTFGYGPRFLHSTGQLHKGGAPIGLFLQLLHDSSEDAEVPEAGYTFNTLKNAQAVGDLETLLTHGLPAERLHLDGDPAQAIRALAERLGRML
ncbi:MAG TPA: bifunctional transaldolase/phosoglucose isomerase [Thermoleophilaceae bacterium]